MICDAQGDPQGSLDPIDTFLVAWGTVGNNIFDGLTQRGPDLQVKPGLATEWKYVDDKTLEFKLRRGVKFHDGTPFTADAVVGTFERLLGPEGDKSPQRSNYDAIEKVVKLDDYTVQFKLKYQDPVLLTKLAGYGGVIVNPNYIREKGDATFDVQPVGTGPYRVVEYKKDSHLILEANPDYWQGVPKTKRVVFRFLREDTPRVAEFMSGACDILQGVPPSQVEQLKQDPAVQVIAKGSPTALALRFDVSKDPVNKVEVRRAIAHAINIKAIIDQVLQGFGKPITSFQGDISFGHNPDLPPIEYSPEKARQLLIQSGVAPGTQLELYFNGQNTVQREIAQAIASDLKKVDLEVALKPVEFQTLSAQLIPQAKAGHMHLFGWGGWTLDFDNTAYLLYKKGQRWNPTFHDDAVAQLLEAEHTSLDQNFRAETFKKLTVRLRELMPDVPIYQSMTIWAVTKKVKGFEVPPDERTFLLGVTVEQ